MAGRFFFLGEERWLGEPVDWRVKTWPEATRLWRFQLHYHDFLLDLAAEAQETGERRWADRAWSWVVQWIEACRPEEGWTRDAAWHPYCISRRLPNWIVLWHTFLPSESLADRVLESVFTQADFLARNLEWDLGGNHLIENLRALVFAGVFLDGAEARRWLRKAEKILFREFKEQILPHGEHFERSPMYHAAMLDALLDVRDVAAEELPELSRKCGEVARRMAEFLASVLHPDGAIPLLGDSAFGETRPAKSLLERTGAVGGTASDVPDARCRVPLRGTGDASSRGTGERKDRQSCARSWDRPGGVRVGDYWIFRDAGNFLIFDAGPVGADHLPAHAHADLLTIEASWNGRRLIVDSGVFDYEDGPMRQYCRSSAAHNVLEIDGEDQCDMWSRFRMGYRGWPLGFACGETGGFSWARAEHNAYRRLRVPRVGRWLACRPGGPWFCLDWAEGSGAHELRAYLHFHPDARVEKNGASEVLIEHHGARLVLQYLSDGEVDVSNGWHCPEFGRRLAAPVLRWTARTALPAICAWSLRRAGCRGKASLDGPAGSGTILVWKEDGAATRLGPSLI